MGFKVFPYRFDEPGFVHHVIHKAVAEAKLFRDDSDRERWVRELRAVQETQDGSMVSQALLSTHGHGMFFQRTASLSNFMNRWGGRYATSYNNRYNRNGRVFGEPFWSRPIFTEIQFLVTLRYVLRNPLEAGIVRSVDELAAFKWTSLGALMGRQSRTEQDVAHVLAHFSDDPDEARRTLIKWVRYDSDFDPYTQTSFPNALAQIEQISSRAFRDVFERESKRDRNAAELTLPSLIKWACGQLEVDEEELRRGSRKRRVAAARSLAVFVALELLRLRQSDLARELGLSQGTISHSSDRGRLLYTELHGDEEIDVVVHDLRKRA